MIRSIKDTVRGIGDLPGYGRHPGTGMLVLLVAMGALAGIKDGSWLKAVLGAAVMLVVMGSIYLAGALSRTREYDRERQRSKAGGRSGG